MIFYTISMCLLNLKSTKLENLCKRTSEEVSSSKLREIK
jgi:hypothetical protein